MMINDPVFFETLKDYWLVLSGITGAIIWLIKWRYDRSKDLRLLTKEYSQLQGKIIAQLKQQYKDANTIAEKNLLLATVKRKCPECYQQAIEELGVTDELF